MAETAVDIVADNAASSPSSSGRGFGEIGILHAPRASRVGNRKRTLAAFIVALVALALVVGVGAAVSSSATLTDFSAKNLAPSLQHPFGTDWMGRDMFLRTLAGLSTSVLVGLFAAGVSSLIALVLGAAAALGGKKIDAAITCSSIS